MVWGPELALGVRSEGGLGDCTLMSHSWTKINNSQLSLRDDYGDELPGQTAVLSVWHGSSAGGWSSPGRGFGVKIPGRSSQFRGTPSLNRRLLRGSG